MLTPFFTAGRVLAAGLALLALLAVGCSSTGSNTGGTSADARSLGGSVTYSNPARGSMLSLVSESMLAEMGVPGSNAQERTLAFYSDTTNPGSTKVCSDEQLAGVAQLFEREGFDEYAIEGEPDREDRSLDGMLELKIDGRTRYMLNSDDSQTDPNAKVAFANLLNMFAQIYGEVRQYQAVDGQVEFKKPQISTRLRRQARPQDGGAGLFPGSLR